MLPGCCLSRPGKEPCYQQAEDEPADVAKTAAPPPFAEALNSPRLASGTQHGGDGAAGAQFPAPGRLARDRRVIAVCVIIAVN